MRSETLPHHLDVDLSAKCNLRCSFCHLSYFTPKDRGEQISLQEFTDHIDPYLDNLKSLTLFSKFEVLTCRDFIPIFKLIRGRKIDTYFSTNGILLTDDVLDLIVGNLTYLTVSVTGFNREQYLRYMRTDAFDIVEENLAKLNALKKRRNTELPKLRISMVGMQSTLESLTDAADFAKKHCAAGGVQMTSLYVFEPGMRKELPAADTARYDRMTRLAIDHAARIGVPFELQSGTLEDNTAETEKLGHRPCYLPWQRLSIQPNGDVYPCPVSQQPVGNMFDNSLAEIWRGDALSAFRKRVNTVDPDLQNEDCQNCLHCRHHAIHDADANDLSTNETFFAGMTRKVS
tara:strand:+ start:39126 stop:40160 length:1035 start_codon:yes stop_codon:yes gene_type:complete